MAISKKKKFDIQRIRKIIENERYIDNCRIPLDEIEKIYDDFCSTNEAESVKNDILFLLNRDLPRNIHSVRGRVKDPDHLIEKIYRNSAKKPEKYEKISVDNYNKIITDLIGIRVIILDKRDWKGVHDCLINLFENNPNRYVENVEDYISLYDELKAEYDANPTGTNIDKGVHAEKPVVYAITEDDRVVYADETISVNESRSNYRSIHYIVWYKGFYFEIQVRTLFDEGWLEFDHRIKYPYDQANEKKKEYAEILNSLAQAADRLISFYNEKDFKKSSGTNSADKSDTQKNIKTNDKNSSLDDKMKSLF